MGSELPCRMMSTCLWEEQPLNSCSDLGKPWPTFGDSREALCLSADGDVAVGEADDGDPSQPCCMKLAATDLSSGFHLC